MINFYKIILLLLFFFMKIIFIFSCSRMFRNVKELYFPFFASLAITFFMILLLTGLKGNFLALRTQVWSPNDVIQKIEKTLTGAHNPESATLVLGLCHGVFTDQFIFRHILGHFLPWKKNLHHVYERIRSIRYQKGKLNVIKRQKISFLGL